MFKFIIITFAIMYFFPRVLRWGLKLFISNQMDKVQQDFKAQTKPKGKEGEIKVDYSKASKADEHLKGGEYVDYEEVKE